MNNGNHQTWRLQWPKTHKWLFSFFLPTHDHAALWLVKIAIWKFFYKWKTKNGKPLKWHLQIKIKQFLQCFSPLSSMRILVIFILTKCIKFYKDSAFIKDERGEILAWNHLQKIIRIELKLLHNPVPPHLAMKHVCLFRWNKGLISNYCKNWSSLLVRVISFDAITLPI